MQFEPSVPHLDARNFTRAPTEQRGFRIERLEIAADRDRFGEDHAIVEDEHRHALDRIDGRKHRGFMLQGAEIDLLHRHRDAFLGEIDSYAARIGSAAAVIKSHTFPRRKVKLQPPWSGCFTQNRTLRRHRNPLLTSLFSVSLSVPSGVLREFDANSSGKHKVS